MISTESDAGRMPFEASTDMMRSGSESSSNDGADRLTATGTSDARRVPARGVRHGARQHQFGHRFHQSVLPHQRQEVGGCQCAQLGVRPTDECLDPGDGSGAQVELRLIDEGEKVVVDRAAQVAEQFDPRDAVALAGIGPMLG